MTISEKMERAMNDQINAELFSAYLYQSMSAFFSFINFHGMANWMDVQAMEEMDHARKFYHFIIERGGRVRLAALEEPPLEWSAPLDAFEAAREHEVYISGRINDLVNLAVEERDHASNIFLHWFVTEQVEEEANADELVKKTEMLQDSRRGLYMLDRELSTRTYTPLTDTEEA